jgi:hypothetical protein
MMFCSYLSRDVGDLFLSSAMAEGRFCERLVVSTPRRGRSPSFQNFSPLKGSRRLEHQGG